MTTLYPRQPPRRAAAAEAGATPYDPTMSSGNRAADPESSHWLAQVDSDSAPISLRRQVLRLRGALHSLRLPCAIEFCGSWTVRADLDNARLG
jgi:hypothetical protein